MKFDIRPNTSSQLRPLSEDERLSLIDPRGLEVLTGENQNWNELTVIGKGERRLISLQVRVEAGARGQMIRVFEVPEGARLTILHSVRVAESACWQNVICVRGKGEVMIRRAIEVFGSDAEVSLVCLGLMEGSAHISVSDEIFSLAPRVKNDLRTKIVLNNLARSEARGRIVVGDRSTQSSSYERLDHLVFGDKTSAVAIPELEVNTDDVRCGHGATVSRPDEGDLFYLRSRGLSTAEAERLLVQGFMMDAMRDWPEALMKETKGMMFV